MRRIIAALIAMMMAVSTVTISSLGYIEEQPYSTLMLTQNYCYIANDFNSVKGIMIHSTGINQPYLRGYVGPDDGILGGGAYNLAWNVPTPGGRQVAVHGFVGLDNYNQVRAYQTLPWESIGWHSGTASDPQLNANKNGYIGIEMCEDDTNDPNYFLKIYNKTVELTAYLCIEFKFQPEYPYIIGHQEGNKAGIASNHIDPEHWTTKFGKSMDTFRADVKSKVSQLLKADAANGALNIIINGTENSYPVLSIKNQPFMELSTAVQALKADPSWVTESGNTHINGEISLDALYILGKKSYVDLYYYNNQAYANFTELAAELDTETTTSPNGDYTVTLGNRLIAQPVNESVPYSPIVAPDGTNLHTPSELTAFVINGQKFYKIRDIAALNRYGNGKFEITYSNGMRNLIPGATYSNVGSEFRKRNYQGVAFAKLKDDVLYVNGVEKRIQAYIIEGNPYYRMSDIASLISGSGRIQNLSY